MHSPSHGEAPRLPGRESRGWYRHLALGRLMKPADCHSSNQVVNIKEFKHQQSVATGFARGPARLHRLQRRRGPSKLCVVKQVNLTTHSGQLVSQSTTEMFDPSFLASMRAWTGR